MIASLEELSPAAQDAARRYLDASAARLPSELRADVIGELIAYLCERLSADATAAEVTALTAQAGPVGEPTGRSWLDRLLAGLSPRDADGRIAATWWNPADERLLLPRAVGLGWDVNFGAVAVRLGLIEPDAETVPFTSTPDTAFKLAAGVPVGLAAATVLHYLVRGRSLPARLPSHWGVSGAADAWTPKGRAAAIDLLAAVGSAGVAIWAATSSRPSPNRAGAIAGATLWAGISAGTTVLRSLGDRPRAWLPPVLLAPSLGAVAGVLTYLARSGRSAEIEHDKEKEA